MTNPFARAHRAIISRLLAPAVTPIRDDMGRHARATAEALKSTASALTPRLKSIEDVSNSASRQLKELGRRLRRERAETVQREEEQLVVLRRDLADMTKVTGGLRSQVQALELVRFHDAFRSMAQTVVRDDAFRFAAQAVTRDGRTLLGYDRLYTLWQAAQNVGVLGLAAAEVGVYRGGTSYFLAQAFKIASGMDAELHVFDTFEGHPAGSVSSVDVGHRPGLFMDTSYADVCAYLSPFAHVRVHRGDIMATLPGQSERRYGLVHLDTDLYASTLFGLEYFGQRMGPGGIVVVDDFDAPKCPGVRQAVQEYLGTSRAFLAWQLPSEQLLLIRVDRDTAGAVPLR